MNILVSNDIEYEVQKALKDYFTIYCRPLPENYTLPNLLVTQVGGNDTNTIDFYEVVIDSRAETEGEANEYLRFALGTLKQIVKDQSTVLRSMRINTSGSWGNDPVRPDLAMCSARIELWAHLDSTTIDPISQ
jgi:hypothetical protein